MLDIDSSDLREYANYLSVQANQLQRYKREYFAFLARSPKVMLEEGLLEKIDAEVYRKSGDNEWYRRTGRLKNPKAVNYTITEGKLILYMDDEWLRKNTSSTLSRETGYDPRVHKGNKGTEPKSYSERVEYGFHYKNDTFKDYTTEPRPFMSEYFDDVVEKIEKGLASPYELIKPIIEGWDNV